MISPNGLLAMNEPVLNVEIREIKTQDGYIALPYFVDFKQGLRMFLLNKADCSWRFTEDQEIIRQTLPLWRQAIPPVYCWAAGLFRALSIWLKYYARWIMRPSRSSRPSIRALGSLYRVWKPTAFWATDLLSEEALPVRSILSASGPDERQLEDVLPSSQWFSKKLNIDFKERMNSYGRHVLVGFAYSIDT